MLSMTSEALDVTNSFVLGHEVTGEGVQVDPRKIKVIVN